MSSPRFEGLDAMRVAASFGVVFLHVSVSAGSPQALEQMVKLRDFALPFLVMTAFFLLTVSLKRKPSASFTEFFPSRLRRLWIPMMAWTIIYSLLFSFPDPILFLTGYRHLWFLQFLFLASLAAYPMISRLGELNRTSTSRTLAICGATTLLYAIFIRSWLESYTGWYSFSSESNISLQIFVSQACTFIAYIPIAVGLGLVSDRIRQMFSEVRCRRVVLIKAFAAMALHLASNNAPLTREIYGIAVFVAALLPWPKISWGPWKVLVAYSYGIYILHFIPIHILWIFLDYTNPELGGAAVLAIALIIYVASFSAAVAVRKLFPANWLIPLVSDHLSEKEIVPRAAATGCRVSVS